MSTVWRLSTAAMRRAGNVRRVRGMAPGGHVEGRGTVPWYVPDGAEFDYEDARGYRAGDDARVFTPTDNPWSRMTPEQILPNIDDLEEQAEEVLVEEQDPDEEAWSRTRPVRRPVLVEFEGGFDPTETPHEVDWYEKKQAKKEAAKGWEFLDDSA